MHERSVASNLLYIVLENAKISGKQKEVELIRIIVGECQDCKREFDLNKESFKCPYCKSSSIQIISGDELFIQDIILS